MIEVKLKGAFGNQLGQYCLGRVLASKLDFRLTTSVGTTVYDVPCFLQCVPGFSDSVGKLSYSHPVVRYGNHFDISAVLQNKTPRKIILDHYFQLSSYYIPYRNEIREWLRIEPFSVPDDTLAVHVRLGDFNDLCRLPFSYYAEAIESVAHSQTVIVTDSPTDEFVVKLGEQYGADIKNDHYWDDFRFLMGAKKVVLSQSTFSWWASFLSDADCVVYPIPKTGWWAPSVSEINLRVDEPRYKYTEVK